MYVGYGNDGGGGGGFWQERRRRRGTRLPPELDHRLAGDEPLETIIHWWECDSHALGVRHSIQG